MTKTFTVDNVTYHALPEIDGCKGCAADGYHDLCRDLRAKAGNCNAFQQIIFVAEHKIADTTWTPQAQPEHMLGCHGCEAAYSPVGTCSQLAYEHGCHAINVIWKRKELVQDIPKPAVIKAAKDTKAQALEQCRRHLQNYRAVDAALVSAGLANRESLLLLEAIEELSWAGFKITVTKV